MKHKTLAFLTAVLCLATVPLEPLYAVGGLARLIVRGAAKHADEAGKIRHVAQTGKTIKQLYSSFASSISPAEFAGISRAYSEVETAILLG